MSSNQKQHLTDDPKLVKRSSVQSKSNQITTGTKSTAGKRYKLSLICAVCEGDAHGYNFDAISCESCKAFFRRNALRSRERYKCHRDGNCDITGDARRKCKKCRLEKCFQIGMRKEWILTDKEKEAKRIKIEQNRRLRQIHDNQLASEEQFREQMKLIHSNTKQEPNPILLTNIDWSTIDSIQRFYRSSIDLNPTSGICQYPLIQPIQSTKELFDIPIHIAAMRLITFIKQIPEFQDLNRDDQIYLVKLNCLTLTFLHSLFIFDDEFKVYHEPETNDALFSEQDWMNTINEEFHHEMKRIRCDLSDVIHSDEKILKLFFLLILFSNSCYHSTTNISFDLPMKLFHHQTIYTNLLYKYCLETYGSSHSSKLFIRYVTKIIQIQQLVHDLRNRIENYLGIDQLSPLMRSLI